MFIFDNFTLGANEADREHCDPLGGGNLLEQPDVIGVVIISKVDHACTCKTQNDR